MFTFLGPEETNSTQSEEDRLRLDCVSLHAQRTYTVQAVAVRRVDGQADRRLFAVRVYQSQPQRVLSGLKVCRQPQRRDNRTTGGKAGE